MKKFLGIFLALLLSVTLVACNTSSQSSTSSAESSEASSSSEATSSEASEETPGDHDAIADGREVNILFWEHNANVENQSPFLWHTAEAFMKQNPNVKIEFVGTEPIEHNNKIMMAAQSGQLPDMFFVEWPTQADFIELGLLYDISDSIPDIKDHFLPGMLRTAEDGGIYGLPNEPMLPCYFYNTEIFDEYGVDYPQDDWTWDDFVNCCQSLKDAGVTPMSAGGMSSFAIWMHQETLVRFGFQDHYDGIQAGTDSWVNDDFLHAYEKIAEVGEKGFIPENTSTLDYYQACEAFYGGNCAFLNAGVWECGKITSAGMADKTQVWLGPQINGAPANNLAIKSATAPYCISKAAAEADADKCEAMLAYFNYMYGPEGTQIMIDDAASVPVTMYDNTSFDNASPMIQKLMDALDNSYEPAKIPDAVVPSSFQASLYDSVWGTLYGTYTPEQALEQLQSQWDALG